MFAKVRVADALVLENSGINRDLFSYGLKAHFDFVVTDGEQMPLFAVEFDGPHHDRDSAAGANDQKKNALCEIMGLPLVRVRDEHVFQKARGIDYLSWLTELFFGARSLQEAQAKGHIPDDEPLDPMMFVSHPHVPGRFPLWLSAVVRLKFERWRDAGILRESVPFGLHGYDENGLGACLVVLCLTTGDMVMSKGSIYLRGFGIAPSDVAGEISTVNLAHRVESHAVSNAATVRREIIQFLRCHTIGSWYGTSDPGFGFSVGYRQVNGGQHWYIGALGAEPAITIDVSPTT